MTTSITPPDAFFDLAQQLAEFRETHGRLPVQCDADDPHERRLGDFLRVNRRALTLYSRGERVGSVPARMHHLDTLVPGWRTENTTPGRARTPNREFSTRVRSLARFVNTNSRLPMSSSAAARERTLAKFIDNMKQARQGRGTAIWDGTRDETLGREVPGWDTGSPVSFEDRVGQVRTFVQTHGREPKRSHRRMAEMTESARREASLAQFVHVNRTRGSEERKQAIDLALAA